MARSNPLPCFGKLAGERLTVTLVGGTANPELVIALRTRSFASPSEASGKPTRTMAGNPDAMSTSTSTIVPETPLRAIARVLPMLTR